MATQAEIQALYDWLDLFQELRLGKYADITCAFFDGDFTKTLNQAQHDKHEWVLKNINFKPGMRVLDIGCGWGPMLKVIQEHGGTAVGLTLSQAQVDYCKKEGLDARLLDYKTANVAELGQFDAVVSIGALEHFCSIEEFEAGKQDDIYAYFFKFCYDLLKPQGRLYLHMMIWGKGVPDQALCTQDSPRGSNELIIWRLKKFYPGSWLPTGKDQLVHDAEPYFNFLFSSNGRKDYIETLNRWNQATKSLLHPNKFLPALWQSLKLVPRLFYSPDFRVQLASLWHDDQRQCFIREIMSHERMFFEKK